MLPNFIIIGTARAGTTIIKDCLSEHPDIFVLKREESFFREPNYSEIYSGDISLLEKKFVGWSGEKAVGLKMPDYLLRKESPKIIHKHLPDAKLIVSLRDPVDRAISNYYFFMKNGLLPARSLNEGMMDLLNGNYDKYKESEDIIEYGFYFKQLRRYLKFFDREQIKILLYEDLENDPLSVYEDILSFLEVDTSFIPKKIYKRVNTAVRSIFRCKWLSYSNYLKRDYNNNYNVFSPKKKTLMNKIKFAMSYSMQIIDKYIYKNILSNKMPKISAQIIEKLQNIYREDVINLSYFDRSIDLNHWQTFNTKTPAEDSLLRATAVHT